jgi:hypothetical protein
VGPGDQEQVNLSWQNTPNNEDSYQLQRSVNGGAFENLGSTKQDWTATADRNVIPGDAYSYRVEALNSAGPSGWSPSTYTPVPPGVICLLSGDDTGNPIVDQAHQSVGAGYIINSKFNCVAAYSFGAEGYFSLAWFGYSPTWLGFNSTIWPGYRVEGKIYDTDKFGKVVSSKVVTPQQEASWLSYMAARDKTPGVYDLAYHNCRTYSQWEYNAAPGNH